MPVPVDHPGAAVLGDTIHVLGGRLKSSYAANLATHNTYLVEEDHRVGKTPLPTPRSGIAVAASDGRIYVISVGPEPGGSFSDMNEVFVPSSSSP